MFTALPEIAAQPRGPFLPWTVIVGSIRPMICIARAPSAGFRPFDQKANGVPFIASAAAV